MLTLCTYFILFPQFLLILVVINLVLAHLRWRFVTGRRNHSCESVRSAHTILFFTSTVCRASWQNSARWRAITMRWSTSVATWQLAIGILLKPKMLTRFCAFVLHRAEESWNFETCYLDLPRFCLVSKSKICYIRPTSTFKVGRIGSSRNSMISQQHLGSFGCLPKLQFNEMKQRWREKHIETANGNHCESLKHIEIEWNRIAPHMLHLPWGQQCRSDFYCRWQDWSEQTQCTFTSLGLTVTFEITEWGPVDWDKSPDSSK